MSTITVEQEKAIAAFLKNCHLSKGLRTKEGVCSIAAINLALMGELTAQFPACMSEVIGLAIIDLQDEMPDEMRNSKEWRQLLPVAAGTGREKEKERQEILLDWMWTSVLPSIQDIADKNGFGYEWQRMTLEKTVEATAVVKSAAAAGTWPILVDAVARAATDPDDAGWAVTAALFWGAEVEDKANYWNQINPCALLLRMIEINA